MISDLQAEAWALSNASYHERDGEAYRARARALYEQDIRERIAALLARGDEQNSCLDEALAGTRDGSA